MHRYIEVIFDLNGFVLIETTVYGQGSQLDADFERIQFWQESLFNTDPYDTTPLVQISFQREPIHTNDC